MNRIKTTTTSTGTGNIVVSTTPAARCRPLSDIAAGKVVRMLIEDEAGNDWELVNATVIDATSFSRGTVINGSAGPGVKVNFGGGTKAVFVAAVLVDREIPFNATIPLDRPEIAYMADYTLTGPLAFAPGANPVTGAHVVATIIGNGVDEPTFPGFVKHSTSLPFNKTNGAKNLAQFLRTPGVNRYSISQAAADVVGTVATPADTAAPTLTNPTSASTGTTTGSGSVTTNEGNGTLFWRATTNATELVATVKAGSSVAVSSTGSKAVTVASLTANTMYYLHFVQTDTAGNDSARVTSASFTTAAAGDTTAPTLSAPSATKTGSTTATGSVTTNEANGILYYLASANAVESAATIKAGASKAVTATGAQAVAFTGLPAATTLYGHYLHRDASGNDSTVANSGSFVTDATSPAATYLRFVGAQVPSNIAESGTGPYTYTGGLGNKSYCFATSNIGAQAGVDFEIIIEVVTNAERMAFGFQDTITGPWNPLATDLVNQIGYKYGDLNWRMAGGTNAATVLRENGDWARIRRIGTLLSLEVSKNGGASYTTVSTATVAWGTVKLATVMMDSSVVTMRSATGLA